MARHRWICPVCETGRLLPTRLAKNDARGVCIPCTEQALKDAKGGKAKFVRLACPAKENAQEKKAQAQKEKAEREAAARKAKREAEKQRELQKYLREGVDLRKELTRLKRRIKPFGDRRGVRLCLVPSKSYLWGSYIDNSKPGRCLYVYGDTLLEGQLSLIFGLFAVKNLPVGNTDGHEGWKRAVCEFCNKFYGIRMNWQLNPRVLKDNNRLYYEALEQIRLKALDFPDFLEELRESVYKNNSSRSRLMVNLLDDEANKQVARDYTDNHF